jgi:glutamyl-tRNA synthetase
MEWLKGPHRPNVRSRTGKLQPMITQPAPRGRFAPSPTGALHLGNLRTALVAWLSARGNLGSFIVRMEDLDRETSSRQHEQQQLADLASLGIDWDGVVVRQSDRFDLHRDAIATLQRGGDLYECYCTRREIREAAQAPNGPSDGMYPGTCRRLTASTIAALRAQGRRPALRLRANGVTIRFDDAVAGPYSGFADDAVVQRNDGVPAYNLAVVVDDADQGVTEVVRGDDLLPVTPQQIVLQQRLGLATPTYGHVPLVLAADGTRLAKRHGAVTLADLAARDTSPSAVRSMLLDSLDLTGLAPADFSLARLPRQPWRLTADQL